MINTIPALFPAEFRGHYIDYHASLVFFRDLNLLPGKCSRRDAKRTSPGGPPVRACPRMLSVLVPESRNRYTDPGIAVGLDLGS